MIRVLLVDDQALVRSGFRVILDSQEDLQVVGEAANGEEAVLLAATLSPDVICMDVEMPVMNGIEASRQILAAAEPPAVLILTTFGHEEYLFDALAAGVSGFLLKTSRAEQLIEAVRTLAGGEALLGADVTRAVMMRAAELSTPGASASTAGQGAAVVNGREAATATGQATESTGSVLDPSRETTGALCNSAALDAVGITDREREVLALIATGRSNGEIAGELFLGEATVKTHVSNLLQKIGARDRVQLVVWAHTVGAS